MKLTEKLDLLMREKGINRVELSKGADIPYSTISSLYDKGYENVKLSTLKKLADYFECSLDYIADDNVTERKPSISTIAAHHDGDEFTKEEMLEIENFINYVRAKRKKE